MSESQEPGQNPTSEDLDVEGPNESAPGHEPDDDNEAAAAEQGAPPGSNS